MSIVMATKFFKTAVELGLEGIVSKRAASRYHSGPSRSWLKTKNMVEDEFILRHRPGCERHRRPGHPAPVSEGKGALDEVDGRPSGCQASVKGLAAGLGSVA
jgi:hypothetical protein